MLLSLININYKCELLDDSFISLDTVISFIAVTIALLALIISSRFQVLSFINNQLLEIARTCNSYLQEDFQIHSENQKISQGRASGIVTSLEDAELIIKKYSKSILICTSDSANFKGFFFIHLHSSIKELLKSVTKDRKKDFIYESPDIYDPIRKEQLNRACDFFFNEIDSIIKLSNEREKGNKIN